VPENRAVDLGFVRTPPTTERFSSGRRSRKKLHFTTENRLSRALHGPFAEGQQRRDSDLARYLRS
jgi:hypothetical protein